MKPNSGFGTVGLDKIGANLALQALIESYAHRGIRVNAVAPGAIVTPINRERIDDPQKRAAIESRIPQRRAGTPEEIAGVFAFLASEDASYITGQSISACGGLTLYPQFMEDWTSGGERFRPSSRKRSEHSPA